MENQNIQLLTLIGAGFFGKGWMGGGIHPLVDGGWNPPFLKRHFMAPKIFILQQQAVSHMKAVMFSFHLIPW